MKIYNFVTLPNNINVSIFHMFFPITTNFMVSTFFCPLERICQILLNSPILKQMIDLNIKIQLFSLIFYDFPFK